MSLDELGYMDKDCLDGIGCAFGCFWKGVQYLVCFKSKQCDRGTFLLKLGGMYRPIYSGVVVISNNYTTTQLWNLFSNYFAYILQSKQDYTTQKSRIPRCISTRQMLIVIRSAKVKKKTGPSMRAKKWASHIGVRELRLFGIQWA